MPHTIEERKCAHCGKNFIPAPFHIYKCEDENGTTMLCSYTCKLRYIEQREKQRRKRTEENKKRKREQNSAFRENVMSHNATDKKET